MLERQLLARSGYTTDGTWSRLSGGDMGDVWRCGDAVVKCHPTPPVGLFYAEARGLKALSDAGARCPVVHYVDQDGLVMAYVTPGQPDDLDLAHQLHRIHRAPCTTYGWTGPVFLGRFPLPSTQRSREWRAFWCETRIEPLLTATTAQLGPLLGRVWSLLDNYSPPTEGPSLLHGDLWSGNLLMGADGACFIDPSVWYGERGVDLAMMSLFGGFSDAFWTRYETLYPIPDDVRDALPYYQVYYILVHVHFFGQGYCRHLRQVLSRYGR